MRFKPWMLAIALQGMELAKAGFDPALGLDQHFYEQAKAGGKTVQGLETVELPDLALRRDDRWSSRIGCWRQTLKELATETAAVGKLGDGVEGRRRRRRSSASRSPTSSRIR